MGWIDNEAREKTPLGRFEIICDAYINGSQRERDIILSFLSEEEKETFLQGCGLYHLFTDENFYKQARAAVGQRIYNELHNKEV